MSQEMYRKYISEKKKNRNVETLFVVMVITSVTNDIEVTRLPADIWEHNEAKGKKHNSQTNQQFK